MRRRRPPRDDRRADTARRSRRHHRPRRQLRQKIIEGEYPHGSRLPTVRDLAAEHGVSQQTASAAYAALGALGLVRADARSGTRVTASKQSDAHLGTFTPPDLAVAQAWKPTVQGTATEETTLVRQLDAPALMASWGITEGTPSSNAPASGLSTVCPCNTR
ncbi:GntR family transcriptional regulator [Streptomyces sp. NPDC093105]|uniref:GntR family transcriptional regulator n=1 Tax=Streptomyces sp. NPDC093105 TaxID=3366029 RepID=UPI00380BB99E